MAGFGGKAWLRGGFVTAGPGAATVGRGKGPPDGGPRMSRWARPRRWRPRELTALARRPEDAAPRRSGAVAPQRTFQLTLGAAQGVVGRTSHVVVAVATDDQHVVGETHRHLAQGFAAAGHGLYTQVEVPNAMAQAAEDAGGIGVDVASGIVIQEDVSRYFDLHGRVSTRWERGHGRTAPGCGKFEKNTSRRRKNHRKGLADRGPLPGGRAVIPLTRRRTGSDSSGCLVALESGGARWTDTGQKCETI